MSAVTANNMSSSALHTPYMVAYDVVHLQYEVSTIGSYYVFFFSFSAYILSCKKIYASFTIL